MSSLTARAAQWQNSCGCMLTFHRAAPATQWAELPNKNFYLNLDYLDNLLGSLKRDGWQVVTVEELTGRLERGENGSRLVNFSVDDCYKDTFAHVVPVFRRHGVSVTLFVTTGIPDGTMSLGWAGLESILARRNRVILNGETADVSSRAAKQQWFAKISAAWDSGDFDGEYEAFCRVNEADPAKLREEHAITWEMLETLRDDPLVEIGAHTVSHPRISSLPPDGALRELERAAGNACGRAWASNAAISLFPMAAAPIAASAISIWLAKPASRARPRPAKGSFSLSKMSSACHGIR